LVFLGAKGERIHVNAFIGVASVGLVRLDPREVSSFTLREAVLAVKLELSGDNGILAPAMEVQRGLSEDEGTSIGDSGVLLVTIGSQILELGKNRGRESSATRTKGNSWTTDIGLVIRILGTVPISSETSRNIVIKSTSIIEKTTSINE
jgi:hypothetical protein